MKTKKTKVSMLEGNVRCTIHGPRVISVSVRLLILGGVEKGRCGMLSLTLEADGDLSPRIVIGDKSGISSGTEGTGC